MKRRTVTILAILMLLLVGGAGAMWLIAAGGFSARDEPSAVEAFVAKRLRRLSIPSDARDATNPVANSPQVLAEAMSHFADHCATCHANDGSGSTPFGLGMYPPPPDMREQGTQQLTDGELFFVIHNGIRFTGMPAFGDEDPAKDEDSWKLVHFIRRLPDLTPDELEQMETMNPKSPMQIRLEEEMRRFLEGEETPVPEGEETPATEEATPGTHQH